MLENLVWHATIATAGLLVCGALLVRYLLIRQVRLNRVQRFYDVGNDMPMHVLHEVTASEGYDLDFGLHEPGEWELEVLSKGLKRPYLIAHAFYLWEWARNRCKKNPTLFYITHLAEFAVLLSATYPKMVIYPTVKDVLMLIGYDSIAPRWPPKKKRSSEDAESRQQLSNKRARLRLRRRDFPQRHKGTEFPASIKLDTELSTRPSGGIRKVLPSAILRQDSVEKSCKPSVSSGEA